MDGSPRPHWKIWLLEIFPAPAYVVFVFVLGSMPAPATPGFQLNDKLGHLVAFGLMQFLNRRALAAMPLTTGPSETGRIRSAWFMTTGIGGLLELWQLRFAYRSAEWGDFIADALGAALVGVLQWRALRR